MLDMMDKSDDFKNVIIESTEDNSEIPRIPLLVKALE